MRNLLLLALFTSLASSQVRVAQSFGKLPLSFEANRGQADSRVKFLSRGRGYSLLLTSNEAVLAMSSKQSRAAV